MMRFIFEICVQFSDLYEIMATSQDYNELIWAWEGWRDTCGPEMKPMYPRYVELANEAAVINGI